MSLNDETGVRVVGRSAPQFGSGATIDNHGNAFGESFGDGVVDPRLPAFAPSRPSACPDSKPWVSLELDFLNLNNPSPPAPEAEEDIEVIPIKDDRLDCKMPDEVLVLDEVGVCEDMVASGSGDAASCNPEPGDSHGSHDQVKLEAPDGLDDDILSIMCDDNEEDDLLVHVGGDESAKREWSFESRFRSKRKQDTPTDTSLPDNMKRSRSFSKRPPDSDDRSRAGSVHSRLGKSKYYQNDRNCQKPCFNFTKNGNCFRASCQFLHPNQTQGNGTVYNRRRAGHCESSILGHPPHQMIELQRKVQEQQMQLQQQKLQLQLLTQHVQQTEVDIKQHSANQAKQMQESLHHMRQQQEQFNHTKEMFEKLSHARCKMEEHVRLLEDRVRDLEATDYSQQDILVHYQFIADFQQHQLQHFMPNRSSNIRNGPASKKPSTKNGTVLPFATLPDLRHIPPLKKPDDYPPRPRSADSHYPGTSGFVSHDLPLQHHHDEVEGGRQGWCLDTAIHGPDPPLMRDSLGTHDQLFGQAVSNPRVVRILPVRHCHDRSFHDYQHEHATMQPL